MASRVLLVDGNAEHLRLSAEALPPDEYAVDTAGSGCEALQLARSVDHDIIVVGHPLPDMSGLDLTVSLRQRGCHVRVVLVSSRDDPQLSLRAMQAGACDLIVKTYRYYDTLAARLRENLESCDPCRI